jgi:hypothetical protein
MDQHASNLPMRPDGQDSGGSRRRSGRLPQESLVCNLGVVLDLSAGGMKVLCRSAPGKGVNAITIDSCTLPGPLLARITWSKRSGLFSREIGMHFENVTPEMAAALTRIAMVHRYRRAI